MDSRLVLALIGILCAQLITGLYFAGRYSERVDGNSQLLVEIRAEIPRLRNGQERLNNAMQKLHSDFDGIITNHIARDHNRFPPQ